MRSDDFTSRRKATRSIGVTDDEPDRSKADKMSSRGTRYWNSGSIPLIAPDVLGDIISTAGDIGIVISDIGHILSVLVNPAHQQFRNLDHWEGRDIRDFLATESVAKLDAQLTAFSTGSGDARPMELNHTDSGEWEFPIRYTLHQIGPDGALLMLGRDLRPIAEMQQQLVKAQLALERDYEEQREYDTRFRVVMDASREAFVFIALSSGRITDLNSMAAGLLGASIPDLQNSGFAQEFDAKRKGELIDQLADMAISERTKPIELIARRTRKRLAVSPVIFRAAGERFLLCRLQNAEEIEQSTD
ncbi:MAG: transcriptional regulator PpsR, partial [Pseudomonadota bacterium]